MSPRKKDASAHLSEHERLTMTEKKTWPMKAMKTPEAMNYNTSVVPQTKMTVKCYNIVYTTS